MAPLSPPGREQGKTRCWKWVATPCVIRVSADGRFPAGGTGVDGGGRSGGFGSRAGPKGPLTGPSTRRVPTRRLRVNFLSSRQGARWVRP